MPTPPRPMSNISAACTRGRAASPASPRCRCRADPAPGMGGPQFVADSPEAVRTVALETLTALYHRPSGTTHILAPPAPQILEALADRPGNADELLRRMSERFDLAAHDASAAIAARLAELEAAGLVRSA